MVALQWVANAHQGIGIDVSQSILPEHSPNYPFRASKWKFDENECKATNKMFDFSFTCIKNSKYPS